MVGNKWCSTWKFNPPVYQVTNQFLVAKFAVVFTPWYSVLVGESGGIGNSTVKKDVLVFGELEILGGIVNEAPCRI